MYAKKLGLLMAMLVLVAYAGTGKRAWALCRDQYGNIIDCGCACLAGGPTASYTGTGSSCAAASSSARSQGNTEAYSDCQPDSVCASTYVVDTACYWDAAAQVYKEVGYVHFRCLVCE
ncbi:MAG TPA: hypothetical protein VGH73_02605 [Thermoanaerobaculia bacterium]|jgi:hypothetical protein